MMDQQQEVVDDEDTSSDDSDDYTGLLGRVKWALTTDKEEMVFIRETLATLGLVVLIGMILFAVTGVWPPFVAVTSSSMSPNIHEGDLILVADKHKYGNQHAIHNTGIVTYQSGIGTDHSKFGKPGDVIVYEADGDGMKIIHRARFWVDEGENWYDKADERYVGGADNCAELLYCPAPNDGFITKGDNNTRYDQVGVEPISRPVKPEWIRGEAQLRIPLLGHIRATIRAEAHRTTANTTVNGTAPTSH